MQEGLVPYNNNQLLSKVKAFRRLISEQGEGGRVEIGFHWRRQNDPNWTYASGFLEVENGVLTWLGHDNLKMTNWPPTNVALAGLEEIITSATSHIEQVAHNANMQTAYLSHGASQIISNQAERLEREQARFDSEQQQFRIATSQLKATQEDLIRREEELQRDQKALDEESTRIANSLVEEDERRKEEIALERADLALERTELREEKKKYRELSKKLHEDQKAKTALEVSACASPRTCRSVPATAPSSNIPTPRTSMLNVDDDTESQRSFFSTTHRGGATTTTSVPQRPQTHPTWSASTPQVPLQPRRHIIIDADTDQRVTARPRKRDLPTTGQLRVEDIDDEDLDTMSDQFPASLRSLNQNSFLIESEAFAFNPDLWSDVSFENMERLLTYLRNYAQTKSNHFSEHVINDIIVTLRGLLTVSISMPEIIPHQGFQLAVRTLLKRILMSRMAAQGSSAAVVNAFSSAVDGGARPEWVRAAQRQAIREVKDDPKTATTSVAKKKNGKKDSK
jgi:hypothetical protein